MPKFDLAMLDFDGTLADSARCIVYCIQRTFEAHGEEPPTPEAIRATIGIPLAMAMVKLRRKGRATDGEAWAAKYRQIFRKDGLDKLRLFEGTPELLAGLGQSGVRVAIVSARKAEVTRELLVDFGLIDNVQAVYGDTPEGPNKPDPRLFTELIRPRFDGQGPFKAIMVGDTHIDLNFAKHSGVAACWARYGYGDPAACQGLQPEHIVDSPAQVLELI